MEKQRGKKGNTANLKPFPPGVSGNPKGYPKGVPHTATRLKRFLELTQKKKNKITGAEEQLTVLEQMDLEQIANALQGDLAAYKELMDRLEGKAQNKIQLSSDPENPVFFAVDARYKNTDADDS